MRPAGRRWGPAGLYAAYYAGFRGLRVAVMDSLPEPGGQVSALYPEKMVYDVAGLPAIKGQDLIEACRVQADQFDPVYLLEQRAEHLHASDEAVEVVAHTGLVVRSRATVVTGGIGTFSPPATAGCRRVRWRGDHALRASPARAHRTRRGDRRWRRQRLRLGR